MTARRLALAALLLACVAASPAAAQPAPDPRAAIPPGHETTIRALVEPLPAGARLEQLTIRARAFTFDLDLAGTPVALQVDADRQPPARLTPDVAALPAPARALAQPLLTTVTTRLSPAFWASVLKPRPPPADPARVQAAAPPRRAPVAWWPLLAGLWSGALLLLAALRARRPTGALLTFGAAAAPLLYLAATADERALITLALSTAAVAGLGALALPLTRRLPAPAPLRSGPGLALDAAAVLAWSLLVRLVLTTPNVLTDGGSMEGRAFKLMPGFGGVSVLFDLLLPGAAVIDPTVAASTLLSALAPVGVLLLGRALLGRRPEALLAGLAMASLPVHAALFSSDFESGPTLALLTVGLGALLLGLREARPLAAAAGAALTAYAVWGRPEAVVAGVPVAAAVLVHHAVWRRDPRLLAPLAWLGLVATARIVLLRGATKLPPSRFKPWGPVWDLPMTDLLAQSALLPPWLWAAPVGLVALWRRDRAGTFILVLGLMGGYLPLQLSDALASDATETHMEVFRYGAFAMPWACLLAAAGLGALGRLLLGRRPGGIRWATGLAAGALVATPLVNLDYLGVTYGPQLERQAFLDAVEQVDGTCWIVAPDDLGDEADQGGGTIEIHKRYELVLADAEAQGLSRYPRHQVVGTTEFLAAVDRQRAQGSRALPTARQVVQDGRDFDPGLDASCWYYFRGLYCDDGFEGHPTGVCQRLEAAVEAQPVYERTFEYRHHRLVTRPDLRRAPLYDPARRLELFRLTGLREP